jgi:hypothetical protein
VRSSRISRHEHKPELNQHASHSHFSKPMSIQSGQMGLGIGPGVGDFKWKLSVVLAMTSGKEV